MARMKTWIAYFRGINVGGHNKLPMKDLARRMEESGFTRVKTYIQSGNVVFQAPGAKAAPLAKRIAALTAEHFGFTPAVLVLPASELAEIAAANPYPEAESDHKSLHLFLLLEAPKSPDMATLDRLRAPTERFTLTDQVLYLHAPDGIGKSKLAERVERALGVPVTARNWRTIRETLALAAT